MSVEPRFYVIQNGALTPYVEWDDAAKHYLGAQGQAIIAEVVDVTIQVVRGFPSNTESRLARARTLLLEGLPPMRIAETTGLSRQAVYQLRTKLRKEGLMS